MTSQRMDVIVTWPAVAFVVAVGLELCAVSPSERIAPQKRGMKNTKVPRRLKTAAKTLDYANFRNQSIRMNEDGDP